jgi:hypothetical protein
MLWVTVAGDRAHGEVCKATIQWLVHILSVACPSYRAIAHQPSDSQLPLQIDCL